MLHLWSINALKSSRHSCPNIRSQLPPGPGPSPTRNATRSPTSRLEPQTSLFDLFANLPFTLPFSASASNHTALPYYAAAMLPQGLKNVLKPLPSDTVILSALRTPITRAKKGHFKNSYPEELLSAVLKGTLAANPNLPPSVVDDVAIGVVLSELGGSKVGRMALNHAGFPPSTSLHTVNRACASSLQAIAGIANEVRSGMIDVGIGAGMESMTRGYATGAIPTSVWPTLKESEVADVKDCLMPMGLTSENVAETFGISRKDQDAYALQSHNRARNAVEKGYFMDEIVPVSTIFEETDKEGNVLETKNITVTEDQVRPNVTMEWVEGFKPAFKKDGGSTGANTSQVSDGAAATLLMRRSTATDLGLTSSIIGKFVGATTIGCPPSLMGIGPALAIPKLLKQFGLEKEDVSRWEINEAFASQVLYCLRELGLEKHWEEGKVNPDGGAIAFGHPLGATGARMVSTLMNGLRRDGGEIGVVSMCVGTGMGMAGLFVREG